MASGVEDGERLGPEGPGVVERQAVGGGEAIDRGVFHVEASG